MEKGMTLALIVDEQITSGRIELPVLDQTAIRIQEMMSEGVYDAVAVEELVGSDPTLSSSLLRHANSSLFGGIAKVVTVRDAIVRLGVKHVAQLVLLSSIGKQYELENEAFQSLGAPLWRHAVATGMGARWLATRYLEDRVQEAFLGGLLHDIGKLLLVRVLDDLVSRKVIDFVPSQDLVSQILDGLHCASGATLLQHWNIPDVYVDIVRTHHDEEYRENDALQSCIRLADMACNRVGIGVQPPSDISLAASVEAQRLRASEVALAELEIMIEDSMELAQ